MTDSPLVASPRLRRGVFRGMFWVGAPGAPAAKIPATQSLFMHRLYLLTAVALFAFATQAPAAVTCSVKTIELPDAFAGQQLLVSDSAQDVTREATYASTNPAVAKVDAKGYVSPAGDGAAVIQITRGADKLDIPVTVKGFGTTGRGVDFRTEVMPLLSKHGCNAGGCHGKQSGQNGFKLSLFGFDTQFDYEAIEGGVEGEQRQRKEIGRA